MTTIAVTEPKRSRRSRKTRPGVLVADRTARIVITLGGLGTILAVSMVCVFLVWVVLPLLWPESMQPLASSELPASSVASPVVHMAVDDHLNLVWLATADGVIRTCQTSDARVVSQHPPPTGEPPVASAFALRGGHVAYAYADKTVQLGRVEFVTSFLSEDEAATELKQLARGELVAFGEGVVQRTPEGQLRFQGTKAEFQEPMPVETESDLVLIDQSVSSKGNIVAVLTRNGELHVAQITERKNLLTGKITSRLREGKTQVDLPEGRLPRYLQLAGLGDSVLLIWEDGLLQRFDTRVATQPVLAEQLNVLADAGGEAGAAGATLTSATFLTGKNSLVCGDSLGRVRVWFRARPPDATTVDGAQLVMGHELSSGQSAVAAVAPSAQSRMLAVAYEDGALRLFYVTSEQQLVALPNTGVGAGTRLTIAPKDDALLALTGSRLSQWSIHAPHPETTLSSILLPVWYEGYSQPEDVWQSSSGTDDFEEKYGLTPLIFGTVKATFYSMLFGAPLALLAAIYTSEFLHPRMRTRVKPMIEIMASLPSVVLGFLAALVIAPFIEDIVPECLAVFLTVPFTYMLFAHVWQLLPERFAVRARGFRLLGMVLALPVSIWLGFRVGRVLERWFFAGDIMAWLDGQIGSGIGGWMFVLIPLSALVVFWSSGLLVWPKMRQLAGNWSRTSFAFLDLVRFLVACLAVLLLAYLLSAIFNQLLGDPRGMFLGTYVQRNAMIVGFIMGFAIIPIIYTISDDALSAVPESLRAASLGAGATPWQTAIRIVIPTAMSGLFSAMMVGLGRAVGETMIVLMAAGNTPVKDWNIFNGFRTLSANIAVELPEAVINSTHYRMLFLAALALFVMTFAVNTIAEVVRLRFRKRAFQL